MTKYKELMERIEVSEEMESRVLKNVEQHLEKKRRRKRLELWAPAVGILAAAGILVMILQPWKNRTEVSSTEALNTSAVTTTEEPDDLAAGYYFNKELPSLAELSSSIGFDVKEPVSFSKKYNSANYINISNKYAEIDYSWTDRKIIYRMSKEKGDISGVYLDEDAKEKTLDAGGYTVTLKGSPGKYQIAVWTDGSYSYSLYCEQGLNEDEVASLVKDTMK